MKLTIKTIAMASLMLGITIAGCKKEKAAEPTPVAPAPTKTELLTGKNWILTAATINPGIDMTGTGVLVTDVYPTMQACEKDNTMNFNTNGTYSSDEGPTMCSPSTPQTTSGTWSLYLSENKLITTSTQYGTTSSDTVNIQSLDATSLKINGSMTNGGINYNWVYTYTKQ